MAIPLLFRRRPRSKIFISFYGDKLRKGFISHVIKALRDGGVNVSINNIDHESDHEGWKDVGILNKTKIDNSNIAIVIFSDNFAESERCLNEVMRIDERRSQGEVKVIPILYGLSIEDVRNFEGIFGQCLRKTLTRRQKRFDHTLTQHLMGSLTSVARRNGLNSEHFSNDSDLVEALIDRIKEKPTCISTKQTIGEQVFEEIVSASVVAMFCYCLNLNSVFHDHDLSFFISPRWYFAVFLLLLARHTLRFINN